MDHSTTPNTCETCGRPYIVDESADVHMDPPTDYARGFSRYCLACWLGVGPKDFPDAEFTELEGGVDAPPVPESGLETSDISEFRRTMEKRFKAEDPKPWDDFLERFGKCDGRICYYPSAGSDFRPLVYQQLSGMVKLGLANGDGGILRADPDLFERGHYAAPDLWLLSDFRGDDLAEWLETKVVHRDARVEIRLLAHTELHPQKMNFQQRPSAAYTSLPPTPMTGRVFYLRLAVTNETIGPVECDALYFCVENVHLIQSFLLRRQVPLSHVVWVRDGAGFGGGRMRHDFLVPLLTFFKTRWLFLEDSYLNDDRLIKWPRELFLRKRLLDGELPELHPVGSFQSGGDRVVFCEVDSTRANRTVISNQRRVIEPEMQDEQTKPKPSVYLWLCCEGWMKFGPFEWLRFDEQTSAFSESTGKIVAWKEGKRWFIPTGRGAGMAYDESFMITTSPRHPDPSNRSWPRIKPMTALLTSRNAGDEAGSCDNELERRKDEWEYYYDTDFQNMLHAVLERFPSKSECKHCRAPEALRVERPTARALRELFPDEQRQLFLCCWYGLSLVTQGLHRYFYDAHQKWQDTVFCPLAVHQIGMGCVQVSPSRSMLQGVNFDPKLWDAFIYFFRERILSDVERITDVEPSRLMEKIHNDRLRQNEPLSWYESKFFRS